MNIISGLRKRGNHDTSIMQGICGNNIYRHISWHCRYLPETGKKGLIMLSCRCRDLGMDCEFVTTGKTENEILRKFSHHAESVHHIPVLPPEIILRIEKAIRPCGSDQVLVRS